MIDGSFRLKLSVSATTADRRRTVAKMLWCTTKTKNV